MGCGASREGHGATTEPTDDATIQIVVGPQEAPTEKRHAPGPPVKLSKAQELANKKREEEKAEEERKKRLTTTRMSEGPMVRHTRASELARDALVDKKSKSPMNGSVLSPSGSGTVTSSTTPRKTGHLTSSGAMSGTFTPTQVFSTNVPLFVDEDFEGFSCGKMLGKGAFGSSYECTLKNGTLCCVKVIDFGGVADAAHIADLKQEITLMKRLIHPHIVQYYGSREDSEKRNICIFMELVTGGTLTKYMAKYPKVPKDLARKWARQMLLGVKYLHDAGIVHRDIKGANILMTADGEIRENTQTYHMYRNAC